MSAVDSFPLIERMVLDTALKALPPALLAVSQDATSLGLRITPDAAHAFSVQGLSDTAGGISWRFFIDGLDSAPLAADLFSGFNIALTAFEFTLANGGLASSHIAGELTIPYFTD